MGSITAWGQDSYNKITDLPATNDFTKIVMGGYIAAGLRFDGSIVAWGHTSVNADQPPSGTGYVDIDSGEFAAAALTDNGTIRGWGTSTSYVLTHLPTGSGYRDIAIGGDYALAINSEGAIEGWGYGVNGVLTTIPSGSNYVKVAAGTEGIAAAITSSGEIVVWGWPLFVSQYASAIPAADESGFIDIRIGARHILALREDGRIETWGDDTLQLVSGAPEVTNVVGIDACAYTSTVLLEDGTIRVWGNDLSGQITSAPGDGGYSQVSCYSHTMMALKVVEAN